MEAVKTAKLKASEVGKMQKLFEDMEEKENLLKTYRKQFDSLCKIYFGKSMKEIEKILSEKSEVKAEPKTEQKAVQKSEPKSEQKEDDSDDYTKAFRKQYGLDKN